MSKTQIYKVFLFTLITYTQILLVPLISAEEMQTDTGFLDVDDISVDYQNNERYVNPTSTPGKSSLTSFSETIEKKQLSPIDFSLTLKERIIDYGELIAANPVSRTHTISVRNTSAPYYSVFTFQNHQLRDVSGNTIPDTTCDNGACTETRSAAWTSPLVYGLGYRCDDVVNRDCDTVFSSDAEFKQFPDQENQESYHQLLHGTKSALNTQASVTLRLNTAASQPKNIYSNTVSYILVPGL